MTLIDLHDGTIRDVILLSIRYEYLVALITVQRSAMKFFFKTPHLITITFGLALTSTIYANAASAPWENLPELNRDTATYQSADINGVKISFSDVGKGAPVIMLHGGPANSSYLQNQVRALEVKHRVISIDTRGHGRSTLDEKPLSYDLFADDVVSLMSKLGIDKADFVGWSDGGITSLDVAMRYPEKVKKVVAFGANVDTNGVFSDADKKPAFSKFLTRAANEYQRLSPTPDGFEKLNDKLAKMYATQPDWTPKQLSTIEAPVLVIDGDHDEVIRPEHTKLIASSIKKSTLYFIPNTSHFAFIQAPYAFNKVMLDFLDE
ncbi:alpha/beta fold hydrolase [Pseudomonas sp. NY15435]|uniref:alpha/beta fold hydrolase n=1 Tax=Pseudomonas sp. NY15435 TaxID=3400358 RepID=UPI003A843D86